MKKFNIKKFKNQIETEESKPLISVNGDIITFNEDCHVHINICGQEINIKAKRNGKICLKVDQNEKK